MSINRERNGHKSRQGQKSHFSAKSVPVKPDGAGRERSEAKPKMPQIQRHKVSEDGWIWGVHAVEAALKNSARKGPFQLFATEDRAKALPQALIRRSDLNFRPTPMADFMRILPQGAVHQGIALNAPPPEGDDLEALMQDHGVLLMLDQVTDPQNVGAIFRSSAAFGVQGLIMQDRHSPVMQGVLAKTAAGAMDMVPFAKVTNLSRALESLRDEGWISIGLAGNTDDTLQGVLNTLPPPRKVLLVLGSEGDGLRRLVAEHCDHLAKIPMPGGFESLNVSHAASIALYEACARN
ncbi:23S rRNA (guanosine(2251)-2'-O)-methyltransferase RlmB [Asticcacaulis sp. SL142]|uniref:23S rRNA (guanosine(2251)-2'-O)-methyltransferase RlmB n=1 Tax=Asticcacaulis sp. SL142 TaxID=2995155 RepID=UPI003B63808F